VAAAARVEDRHDPAEVGELAVGEVLLAQPPELGGGAGILGGGGEQSLDRGVAGLAGVASGELGLQAAQRVLALGGAAQHLALGVEAEVGADQVRGLLRDLGDDRLLLAVQAAREAAVGAAAECVRHQSSPARSRVACRPKECMAWTSVSTRSREPRETIARPSSWTCIISCSATRREQPK